MRISSFGVIVALLSSSSAIAAEGGWRVTEVAGPVQVMTAHGTANAQRGTLLAPGDRILSGRNGHAVLVRGDDIVTVQPQTQLQVPQDATGLTAMIEQFGSALFSIGKRAAPHFGVQTPYLAAVVKGTKFIVTVKPEQGSWVQVTEGAVEVATNDGGARGLVRPGMVGTVGASDKFQLTVSGETTKVVRSPNAGAATAPAAPITSSLLVPAVASQSSIAEATDGLVKDGGVSLAYASLNVGAAEQMVLRGGDGGSSGDPEGPSSPGGSGGGGSSDNNGNSGGSSGGTVGSSGGGSSGGGSSGDGSSGGSTSGGSSGGSGPGTVPTPTPANPGAPVPPGSGSGGDVPGTPPTTNPGTGTPGQPVPADPTPPAPGSGDPTPPAPTPGDPTPPAPVPGDPTPPAPVPGDPTPPEPVPGDPTPPAPVPGDPTPPAPVPGDPGTSAPFSQYNLSGLDPALAAKVQKQFDEGTTKIEKVETDLATKTAAAESEIAKAQADAAKKTTTAELKFALDPKRLDEELTKINSDLNKVVTDQQKKIADAQTQASADTAKATTETTNKVTDLLKPAGLTLADIQVQPAATTMAIASVPLTSETSVAPASKTVSAASAGAPARAATRATLTQGVERGSRGEARSGRGSNQDRAAGRTASPMEASRGEREDSRRTDRGHDRPDRGGANERGDRHGDHEATAAQSDRGGRGGR